MSAPESYSFPTLPDYLAPGLELVFIGINPSLYSVQRGHYFARPTSRFWPAFSRSHLSESIRGTLGRETLAPEDDSALLALGIGFTDVVKVPGRNAAQVRPDDFREGAPLLLARLQRHQPRVACFHGLTAYRAFARYSLAQPKAGTELGPQPAALGPTRLFVVPDPSPANAHFRLADQTAWYDRLADFLEGRREPSRP